MRNIRFPAVAAAALIVIFVIAASVLVRNPAVVLSSDLPGTPLADQEWAGFMTKLEEAQLEFVQGRSAAFRALWSHRDDVTIFGGFGGVVERGWDKVKPRLDWAGSLFSEGTRTRQEIATVVGRDFAYTVRIERIRFRIPGRPEQSTQELRVTQVFRREPQGWRIVHRHADPLMTSQPPR